MSHRYKICEFSKQDTVRYYTGCSYPKRTEATSYGCKKVKLREEAMTKCSHLHSLDIVSDSICSVGFFPTKRKSWFEKRNKRGND